MDTKNLALMNAAIALGRLQSSAETFDAYRALCDAQGSIRWAMREGGASLADIAAFDREVGVARDRGAS